MSVSKCTFSPRRRYHSAVGFFAFAGLFGGGLSLSAHAATPRYPDTMPLSQVKAGMRGYGLTTFKGTTISRFQVTVIGVLKKVNNGRDLILIRMKGGPITERGANLIQGMSGSPIYLNGKVIGAFSQGETFPKEPVGMVTPIDDMLEAWDPDIPQKPTYFQPADKKTAAGKAAQTSSLYPDPLTTRPVEVNLQRAIKVGDRSLKRLVLNARADNPLRSSPNVAVMRRASTMLSVSGIGARDRDLLQHELDQHGYAITVAQGQAIGDGKKAGFKGVPLRPGSAFGTFLATGDIQFGATGTITYRRGNRVLGFGHPLFGLGPVEAAITSASIVDIFSGLQVSHHIAIAGPVIGTLVQDRDYSVSGNLDQKPALVPFDVTVNDRTAHRTQTFHTGVFQHPDLTATILRLIARSAVERVHSIPGDVMARVTTDVEAAEVGRVIRRNMVFDSSDIAGAALQDISDITSVISGNPFYPLPVKRAAMTVDIMNGHNTATVERIFLKQGKYEPGDNLDIGIVMKPYRQDTITRTVSLKLPSDLPTGRYQLIVRGGMPSMLRFGSLVFNTGSSDQQTPPVNVRQMVARLEDRELNTDLVSRLILNTAAPALEGEKLSQLPPNISALMRSERNSGVRLERDEVRTVNHSDYVVSGAQQLVVNIVRKNTQEAVGGAFSGQTPQGSGPGATLFSSGGPGSSVNLNQASPGSDPGTAGGDNDPGQDTEDSRAGGIGGTQRLSDPSNAWLARPEAPPVPKVKDDPKPAKANSDTVVAAAAAASAPPAIVTAPTTPARSDESNDRPVGRQMQVWRQTARSDFGAGKLSGLSVSSRGELRLTPTLSRFSTTSETYLWSLVSDGKGSLYAGTGTGGKILKFDSGGAVSTFVTLPVISVQSLLFDKDGSLWAGSGVKGNLYRIRPDGSYSLIHSFAEKYIVALAEDSKGNIYVGPGGGGTVYRVPAGSANGPVTPAAVLSTNADHIMALAIDGQDNLYAGTGNDGIVYRVTPDGKSAVLYDAKENAVTAIVPDRDGAVYIATGPRGLLYRVAADGTAVTLFDRSSSFFTGLAMAPDRSLYASTVNAVYHVIPGADAAQTIVQPLDNPKDVDFLSLALTPDRIFVGTGNIGEVFTTSPSAGPNTQRTGAFESVVHDAHLISRWGMARWNVMTPAGTHIRVETRSGNEAEPDATWAPWTPVSVSPGLPEGRIVSPPARFIQFRVTLDSDSDGAQPLLREMSLGYMTRNQAPHVSFQTPSGGERWSRTQTIRWTGDDPDHDTLTYQLFFSNDAGATWKQLPLDAAKPAVAPAGAANPGLPTSNEKQILDDPNLPPTVKDILLSRRRQGSIIGANGAAVLRETSKSWNTTALPDGTYWLKVVASDVISNPTDEQTSEAISEPFVICNATPRIRVSSSQTVRGDRSVAIEGSVAQSLIAVTAMQYRVDGGEWIAVAAKDGLFDTSNEGYALTTAPLPSGKHTIEIKAFNAAGNTTTEKVDVNVP